MGHYLNFGAGPNELPEPWQNLNVEHDIRKPLRFQTDSVTAILAEHVIEHVPFESGFLFVGECLRVLTPGGVLRVAFPDVGRFLQTAGPMWRFSDEAATYAGELWREKQQMGEDVPKLTSYEEMLRLLVGWGHRCAWTERSMAGVLLAVGFQGVRACAYGESASLGYVDGHHKTVGRGPALLETTILEAYK
jgi:predicted SAM-dependent methyltransferase